MARPDTKPTSTKARGCEGKKRHGTREDAALERHIAREHGGGR